MIYCAFVGPFKDKRLLAMAEDFHKRSQRLWPVTWVELPEKPKDIAKWMGEREGKGQLVSLDAHGESLDSRTFTQWVTQSPRDLYFLAWGADGPPVGVLRKGVKSLSLSPMTYSHELARVLLMEQLYRAGATLKGHPYPR